MNKAVYKVNLSDAFKLLVHDDAVFCSGDLFYYHYGCDGVDDRVKNLYLDASNSHDIVNE